MAGRVASFVEFGRAMIASGLAIADDQWNGERLFQAATSAGLAAARTEVRIGSRRNSRPTVSRVVAEHRTQGSRLAWARLCHL